MRSTARSSAAHTESARVSMPMRLLAVALLMLPASCLRVSISRRHCFALPSAALLSAGEGLHAAHAEVADYNLRARNEPPLITGDYYYIFGQVPPRQISGPNIEQPKWNTFGSCIADSCTYVPIAQRYAAYSKYSQRLDRGLRSFRELKGMIAKQDWSAVGAAVSRGSISGKLDAPAVDALLKAGLLASQLLVSPNNLREKKAASLATFYVNEASYALDLLAVAADRQDLPAAQAAWDFGRDSWNSYLAVVNPSIVPKVGDPFEAIP